MEKVFADTGYWIALLNPRDELHIKSRAISRELARVHVVTSEMILAEFLNCFSEYGPLRNSAGVAVAALSQAPNVTVIPQTTFLFNKAFELYISVSDKNWSLTDCASFVIMKDEGIAASLTHDRHFIQAGFQALLR